MGKDKVWSESEKFAVFIVGGKMSRIYHDSALCTGTLRKDSPWISTLSFASSLLSFTALPLLCHSAEALPPSADALLLSPEALSANHTKASLEACSYFSKPRNTVHQEWAFLVATGLQETVVGGWTGERERMLLWRLAGWQVSLCIHFLCYFSSYPNLCMVLYLLVSIWLRFFFCQFP